MPKEKQKPLKPTSKARSILQEGDEIALAVRMIKLGARLQLLDKETSLSMGRLSRLYHEVMGRSPSKGMLPYSIDWFMTWHANLHATLFYSLYLTIRKQPGINKDIEAIIRAYEMYLEHEEVKVDEEPVLSFMRAWMLTRFFKSNALQLAPCTSCSISFITHKHELIKDYKCGICNPPIRIAASLDKEKTTDTESDSVHA